MTTSFPPTEIFAPADVQVRADAAKADALAFVEANRVDVVDVESLSLAVRVRELIGDKQKSIVAQLAKPKSWANGLHKWFCALEAAALKPFEDLDTYEREQIRAFKVAEDRRREQREREEAEIRRRENETRAATEAASLKRAGEHDLAQAVVAEAISAPSPVVVLPDDTKGVAKFRRSWHWRITHPDLVPREFLTVDERKLTKYATAMRESAKVAGVEFYPTDDPIR